MKRALAHTITALTSASELDIDRSDEDRAFFATKKPQLENLFNRLSETRLATKNTKNTKIK